MRFGLPTARFQQFSTGSRPDLSAARLAALRARLAALGVDGLLLPRADIFQGEYIPASENRLAWVTGFTGSAGFAIVLKKRAALFVDGRYTLQARTETDRKAFSTVALTDKNPDEWLRAMARPGARIGYDPTLFTARGLKRFEAAAAEAGFTLAALAVDPFAAIWDDRPPAPATVVFDHPVEFAGEAAEAKLGRLRAKLGELNVEALLVSECPSLNWLFNIRAGDVPYLPILRAFALVPRQGRPTLFVDPKRLDPAVAERLAGLCDIVPAGPLPGDGRSELSGRLADLAGTGARIRLDEESAALQFSQLIEAAGGTVSLGPDPLALMKSAKNAQEIAGARAAHIRDGAAMVRFLAWFEREIARRPLTEIDATIALEGFRIETGSLVDIAFPTIAGAGPNAALPHYRVSEASNRQITPGFFLIDSGGNYRDGTTDITRTIAIGAPGRSLRAAFTRVLKGMIAISLSVFPKGTSGAQLDPFARQFLWADGKDYDHGTGHGVGSFLSVHEGPQRLSKLGTTALAPGMILSNEPGYYREGRFGIRIENLVVVEPRVIARAEREMLGFETLSYCPIDRWALLPALLTRAERAWLDHYHAETLRRLAPLLAGADLAFLEAACRPL